jgi:ABC-type multidrug transport system ATPase subunit
MQVQQLSFMHHKNAPYFFKDLSFTLAPGKLHALHGKNGVGKTILLNLLSRRVPPHSIVEGKIIGGENAILVHQRFDQMIADHFSFQENLKFACMSAFPHPFSRLKNPSFYPDFLEKFHIDITKPASKLSGGQRQILALLMVLQKERSILLLDEPTATLDEQNAILVFEFLTTLILQNATLLVVCHDHELVNRHTNGQHLYLEMGAKGVRELKISD